MRSRQFVFLCLLVGVGAVALAIPAVAVHDAGGETEHVQSEDETQLGVQMSSFAQASAIETSQDVDDGLWSIALNNSADPAAAVENRTATLQERIDRLNERVRQLEERRENLSQVEYNARASALRTQAALVPRQIERTNQSATRAGVDVARLDELKNNAANLTGPEVAGLARNMTDIRGGPPGNTGPPADAGPEAGNGGPPADADEAAEQRSGGADSPGNSGNGSNNAQSGPANTSAPNSDNTEVSEPGPPVDRPNTGNGDDETTAPPDENRTDPGEHDDSDADESEDESADDESNDADNSPPEEAGPPDNSGAD